MKAYLVRFQVDHPMSTNSSLLEKVFASKDAATRWIDKDVKRFGDVTRLPKVSLPNQNEKLQYTQQSMRLVYELIAVDVEE